MALSLQMSWPAAATLLAGVANLYLARHVWRFRERPGGRWFVLVAALMATACFFYGLALVVFAPLSLRITLEALHWANGVVLGGLWLAFSLVYTGRGHLVRTTAAHAVAGTLALVALFVVTDPIHHALMTDFRLAPSFGAATATFQRDVVLFLTVTVVFLPMVASLLVLLDTMLSYGPLFRSQTLALALTPVLPMIALVAYVFRLGPVPNLNMVSLTLVPHAMLDLYALYGAEMFEFDPATRRIGERTATDDLGNPVVTVDRSGRVITLNETAEDLFDAGKERVVGDAVGRYLGDDLALDEREQTIEVYRAERRRQYRVTSTPFSDATGTTLGYNLVLQDVTDVVQRQQRLAVLNRVLRHNLRNDLSAVIGNAELVVERAGDETVIERGEAILSVSRDLESFSERAREFDRIVDSAGDPDRPVVVASVLDEVAADVRDAYPDATVEVDVPEDLQLRLQRPVLKVVFANLAENAVEHDDEDPHVVVRTTAVTDRSAHFEIVDDGPGIPETEVSVLEDGSETALEHGSGLGLWVVHSGVTAMGGDVTFETLDDGGTRVSLRLPGVVDEQAEAAT